jgi:signal transduction histidine kinase
MNPAMTVRLGIPGDGEVGATADAAVSAVPSESDFNRVARIQAASSTQSAVRQPSLGANALQRLRAERRILESLAGVVGVPRLAAGPQPPDTLSLEDVAGVSLQELSRQQRPALPALLDIVLPLLQTLADMHRLGVVHHNLSPGNVLLVGAPHRPMLTGFSLATAGSNPQSFGPARQVASAYTAPEETGRTGRAADQRADLYAVGVMLYEWAAGRLPFDHSDPLQLIHDILALVPTPPCEIEPGTPTALSDMIMRLLEKEPERRYQSADGLRHDLVRLRDMTAQLQNSRFLLGEHDFAARLEPPAQLVGREHELGVLQGAFAEAMRGNCRGVLVAGAPGVGKTSLINALHPLVSAEGGWFVSGKFDQYRHDISTSAVAQAFCALGRRLLAEPEAELMRLRARMAQALGLNAGLVASIIPELALLLGIVPEVIADDPVVAGRRLARASIDLLATIASAARPVVMVLDDLQWATPGSMAFVDALLAAQEVRGVLLVGTFRAAEIDAAHPLSAMRARWRRLSVAPAVLTLDNLVPTDLAALLGDMLRLPPQAAAELADAVTPRTGGNPFDTVEFINALRDDGVLVHGEAGWNWDGPTIHRYVGRGDVIDLLSARLRRLPKPTRRLLKIMACLGGEVDSGLLRAATGLSIAALDERLAPALDEGLLVAGHSGDPAACFRHDRVQQAAYAGITASSRGRLHLALARRLAASPGFAGVASEQYLPAIHAIHGSDECRLAASLFQHTAAGVRVTNPPLAERLLSAAVGLLEVSGATSHDPLGTSLLIDRHATLYSLGRLDEADAVYGAIESRDADVLQRVDPACVQISSLSNRGRVHEALALGLSLLGRLGIAAPEVEPADAVLRCIEAMAAHAGDDLRRPLAGAPQVVGAAKLISRLMPAAHRCNRAAMAWLVTEAMRLWTEHGPCAELAGPVAHVCSISLASGDFHGSYETLRHVLAVSEARGFEPAASQIRFLLGRHWLEPLENSVPMLQRSREGLLHGGDLQNACFTWVSLLHALRDCAPTLDSYSGEIEAAIAFGTRTGNGLVGNTFVEQLQLVQALRAEPGSQNAPRNDAIDEARTAGRSADDSLRRARHHTTRALGAALFGDTAALVRHAAQAALAARDLQNFYSHACVTLLQVLALAEQARTAPPSQVAELLAELQNCREWMVHRAAAAPFNFGHLLHWIDAERAWAVGEPWAALTGFETALREAASRQRPWHAALIAERAGAFHLSHQLEGSGRALLVEARRRYDAWGASAKVRQLDEAHPFLRPHVETADGATTPGGQGVSVDSIDLLGIVRASQALGSETSLVRLRARVVELLAEMTGATTVRVVVWNDELQQWRLPAGDSEAEMSVDEAATCGLLPLSVLRYVERTREPLLVDDATQDDRFKADPCLRGAERCSLLAVPILHQGATRALLVLENRLSRSAFTADRLDAVMLITGQLAVSLANVQLYESLEQRVLERTRELREVQAELVTTARQAGMAEIATNVLHNVGNVLNSVNISAGLVSSRMRDSKARGLVKAVQLINDHAADLGDYLTRDEKGKLLPGYLNKLAAALAEEQQSVVEELGLLARSVDHIKDIVATQQSHAGAASVVEALQIQDLLEDALRMNAGSLARHQVAVVKEFADVPVLLLDKHLVLQILVNLISNAKQAMGETIDRPHQIILRVDIAEVADGRRLRIRVEDDGEGIAPENLGRLFTHGFTTRKNGHGFGLHSCVLAAKEMGGTLTAQSEGPGRGAIFTLELPIKTVGDTP